MCIFGFCLETVLLLISLANDIECALNTLNRYIISYKKERKKVNKKVSQLIQFHVHAKQLSRAFVLKFQSIKTEISIRIRIHEPFCSLFPTFRLNDDHAKLIEYLCLILFTWSLRALSTSLFLVQVECIFECIM